MSRVETAAAMDRLPWLSDEPKPKQPRQGGAGKGLALITVLAVGAGAFWLGTRSVEETSPPPQLRSQKAVAQVRLPDARPATPAPPEVKITQVPEVEPIVAPPMPVIEAPKALTRTPEKTVALPTPAPAKRDVTVEYSKPVQPDRPQPWPVRVIDGSAGRLVRIGAFASVHQAKRGWWAIVKVNPTLKRLPALVVPVRSLRNGRVYYRLQMGTTSQAHSAVLCQRMRMIAQPCVVIGLAA